MHVTKLVGIMFVLIFVLDLLAAIGVTGTFAGLILTSLVIGIFVILLLISRQPQNRYRIYKFYRNTIHKSTRINNNLSRLLSYIDMRWHFSHQDFHSFQPLQLPSIYI